ncbi:MAG: NAD(P)/FAD-dependent oxidoreductase [Bacteroidales bacterium]|nr:NAD(P)/FAD-dependent oxidoreductase [Bacteroidales bacterium]
MVKAEELSGKYFDVAIIGGGLGGLQCGYILSKRGLKVCILEQNPLLGGCLQSFGRRTAAKDTSGRTVEFDTGLHYVGGLEQGQPLNSIFNYFDLMHLPWQKMDTEAFDEVIVNGKSYMFANGYDAFAARMSEYFPHQKEKIKKYTALLKEVGDALPKSFSPKEDGAVYTQSLFARSAYEFVNETISDPLLREVVAGTSLKMELTPTLPLYTYAQINSSFIQSAWRLAGGGNMISDSLCSSIEKMGGVVTTRARVTEIKELDSNGTEGNAASYNEKAGLQLTINGNIDIFAKNVISNLHPAATLDLIKESAHVRKVYRNRINRLENTTGMFTVNLTLKENAVEYFNRNRYIHKLSEGESLWTNSDITSVTDENSTSDVAAAPIKSMLVSYYSKDLGGSGEKSFARQLDLLTPMSWREVEKFIGTKVGHRGEEYEALKSRKAAQCIEFAQSVIPGLEESIIDSYTSTPLTYRDYTATACGSAYGIRKDYSNLMLTLLTPKTPVPNLYLTGQNLNLHGVLGVSMTSFFTCAEIIGMEAATDGLKFE